MLKTLERIKKIKELEKLIELQKLENLKYEKAALETEEKTVFQEMEKLSKNISFTTFFEISIQRKKLREIEKRKEELEKELKQQEEKVKTLQTETQLLEKYMSHLEEKNKKEQLKEEVKKNALREMLKKAYGSFIAIAFLALNLNLTYATSPSSQENNISLFPTNSSKITFHWKNSTKENIPSLLPYEKILLMPYIKAQSEIFEKYVQELLKAFEKLNQREKQLKQKEEFLKKKEKEIKALLNEAINWENQQKQQINEKLKKLLKIIAKADPDSAGEILSQTPPNIAGEVLINLNNTRKAGEILSAMEPEAGAKVIEYLIRVKEKTPLTVVRKKVENILKYIENFSY